MAEFLKKSRIAYWISTKDIDKVILSAYYLDISKKSSQAIDIPKIEKQIRKTGIKDKKPILEGIIIQQNKNKNLSIRNTNEN